MKRKIRVLGLLSICLIGVVACQEEFPVMADLFPGFNNPSHFPETAYNFSNNNITEDGFKLGKKLFYDVRLSKNHTISCGTCHIQAAAFTHHGHDVSHGIEDRRGTRNSQPIMNLAWHNQFMWDGGVNDLDLQPVVPITAFVEMDESLERILSKLNNDAQYKQMFKKAFQIDTITTAPLLKALSQFMLMCVSSNAKYDSVMNHQASFTAEEERGYVLYQNNCASCHTAPLFLDNQFRNNGIGTGRDIDSGRYVATLNPDDIYKFKVPSLRNLKYTGPYMHDGRFRTLNAVLNHYTTMSVPSLNLDPLLIKEDGSLGIPLTEQEQADLLAFLNTLNDASFINNRLLSE